jgi:hypothetical protein
MTSEHTLVLVGSRMAAAVAASAEFSSNTSAKL